MKGRLFLRLDDALIDRARQYAWSTGQSLSTVVESYFASLPELTAVEPAPFGARRGRHATSGVQLADGSADDDTGGGDPLT
jgi:hypothetical protein